MRDSPRKQQQRARRHCAIAETPMLLVLDQDKMGQTRAALYLTCWGQMGAMPAHFQKCDLGETHTGIAP
jgi:hypothetical protein